MPTVKFFAEDSADPLRLTLGRPQTPQNLTGATVQIVLKDLETGTRITSGTTTVEDALSGVVSRPFQAAERVAGKRYAVECVVTLQGAAGPRTYPGPDDEAVIAEIVQRRT